MRRMILLAVACVVAVLAASAAWLQFRPSQSINTKVTVAQVGDFFVYMPLYFAIDKGFFGRNGISVTVVNTGGDEKSVAAVISGSADFGVGDPTFAAIAQQEGQDVKVVAGILGAVPFWAITKNRAVPEIKQPSQLNGFSVATFPSPSTAYTLQAQMFRAGGLQPNIRQAQFGTLLPLLETGTVDIVLELEPNVSTAVNQGARVVYSLAESYGPFATTGVTVAGKTITTRRAMVENFVRALSEAQAHAHAHPDEVIAVAINRFPSIDKAVVADALKRMLSTDAYPSSAVVPEEAWKKAIQLRIDAGEIRNMSQAIGVLDNSIASAVKK